MKVVWNQEKAAANLKKHGIDFADAAVALEDHFCAQGRPGETRQYYEGVSL